METRTQSLGTIKSFKGVDKEIFLRLRFSLSILQDGPIRKWLRERGVIKAFSNPENNVTRVKKVTVSIAPDGERVKPIIRESVEALGWTYAGEIEFFGVTDLVFIKEKD